MKKTLPYLIFAAILAAFVAGMFTQKGCSPAVVNAVRVDTLRVAPDTVHTTAIIRKIVRIPSLPLAPVDEPGQFTGDTGNLIPDPITVTCDDVVPRVATVAWPGGVQDIPFEETVSMTFNSETGKCTTVLSQPPIMWLDSAKCEIIEEGHGWFTDVLIFLGGAGLLAMIGAMLVGGK